MARSGLRMMPTFPSSSLKFRTAGFPRYGFKAGISDCTESGATRLSTPACKRFPALPQGPSLRSGSVAPAHRHLFGPIRPTRRHIPTSPHGGSYATPSVHIRICLGDPRLVLSFHRCSSTTRRHLRLRGTLRLSIPSTLPKALAFNSV
jgi:hypothetical protein